MTHINKFRSLFSSLWTLPRQTSWVSSGSGIWYRTPWVDCEPSLILTPKHPFSDGLLVHPLCPPPPSLFSSLGKYSPAFTSFICLYWIMCYFPPFVHKNPFCCSTLYLQHTSTCYRIIPSWSGGKGVLNSLLSSQFSGLSQDKTTVPSFLWKTSVLRTGWSSLWDTLLVPPLSRLASVQPDLLTINKIISETQKVAI